MADAKKIVGGLGKVGKALLADGEEAVTASQRAEAGRKASQLIKQQEQVKASEALGQLMEKGVKRTTTTQADRTRVGGGNIGGAAFPAISQADPRYAGKVWGVMDEGTAARLKNLTDPETAWTTMLGSANQLKTNPLVFDKLKRGFIDSMKQGNLSDELAGKINHNLALTFGEGADIRDPKIWREANTFEKRAALADVMMGQGIAPSKGGVAIGGEKSGKGVIFRPTDILKRETEPSLLHTEHGGDVPTFAAGPRLFRIDKESEFNPSLHPGFPTLLKGEDYGINMKPTPTEVYLPDWHKRFKANNPDRKSPGYYDLALGVKGEGLPSQDLNDEYIRHLLREGFKKGGSVDIDASDRRLAKAIEARMAKGGGVDIEASDARLQKAIDARLGMAEGGATEFKKLEFMADGGKLVKGVAKLGKKLMAEEQVASDAIGKAAQSAGMNAPITANKPLTDIKDYHTSMMDEVRRRAVEAKKEMDSWDYKYDKGQRVFTEHGAKNNLPPLTVIERSRHGNNLMWEGEPWRSPKIIDPETGKAMRTPYVPGYKLRRDNPETGEWQEFILPESAIKGDVSMADGGKLVKGAINIGKKLLESGEEAPKVDRLSMSYKDVTKRVPEVADAIEKLNRGEITRAQYNDIVNLYKPVTPYSFVPKPATKEEAIDALRGDAAKSRYGAQAEYTPGSKVGLRLDIPAYTGKGVWVNSIHDEKAKKVAYGPVASVKNADLSISQNESKRIALGGAKAPYAKIKGEWNPMTEEEAVAKAQEYLKHPEWRQIGMDPERHSYFYDRHTMEPITNAEEVIQIGPLVLGKNPKYGKMEDFEYADGGKIVKGGLNIARRLFKTTDGYTFKELPDGRVTDGDMTWNSAKEFLQDMPHAYQQGDQLGQRRASMESYGSPSGEQFMKELSEFMREPTPDQLYQRALNKQNAPKPQLSVVPPEKKAEGGGAFKTLEWKDTQHFDGGGMAVDLSEPSEGSRREPLLTAKDWANIKRNAPEVYEWAKQNVKDEASQLKSVKGAKDFALRTGAQYLGGIPDLVNLGLMGVDAVADTSLSSEKPWFGSEQYIDALHKSGALGENEFPIAETVAGVLAPAGLIRKGIKKVRGIRPVREEPKKRLGGLTAMSR